MVEKLIRNNMKAVVHTKAYGGGWSTWAPDKYQERLCLDKTIASLVLDKDWDRLLEFCKKEFGEEVYLGGIGNLVVTWIDEYAPFKIIEYDGREIVEVRDWEEWFN